jgi:ketosteroid isomerase-like protein
MRHILKVALLSWLVFAPTTSTPQSAETNADTAEIEKLRLRLQEGINSEAIGEAVSVFTEDIVYLQPGSPAVTGRDAIQMLWQGTLERMHVEMQFHTSEVEIDDVLGFVVGDVTWRGTPRSGGDSIVDEGRYIWILRRDDEGWKIARYMRHSRQ